MDCSGHDLYGRELAKVETPSGRDLAKVLLAEHLG